MELALFIYLASLFGKIHVLLITLVVMGGTGYSTYAFIAALEGHVVEFKKTFIATMIASTAILAVVPSERTMYMMAAGYAGQTVAEKIGSSESTAKLQKIINNKLDEYLAEQAGKLKEGK